MRKYLNYSSEFLKISRKFGIKFYSRFKRNLLLITNLLYK